MAIMDVDKDYKSIFYRPQFIFESDVIIILNPDEDTKRILRGYKIDISFVEDSDEDISEAAVISYFKLLSDEQGDLLSLIMNKHKFRDIPNIVIGMANTISDMPQYREMLNMICDKIETEQIAFEIFEKIEDEEFRVYMQMKFGGFPNCRK